MSTTKTTKTNGAKKAPRTIKDKPEVSLEAVTRNSGQILTLFVLADHQDLKKELHDELEVPYKEFCMYGTYDQWVAHLDPNIKGPKGKVFCNLTSESKQYIARFFYQMNTEIENITSSQLLPLESMTLTPDEEKLAMLGKDETEQTRYKNSMLTKKRKQFIVDKAIAANAVCYTAFMFDMANSTEIKPHTTLAKATDERSYFGGLIKQLMDKHHKDCIHLPNLLESIFIGFMKALARKISRTLWFNHQTANQMLIESLLAVSDIDFNILIELQLNLKPKESKPKKVVGIGAVPVKDAVDNKVIVNVTKDTPKK